MMSRKDYRAISEILKQYRHSMSVVDYSDLVNDFAKHLAHDNPRFNVELFRKAAGVEEKNVGYLTI